MKIHISIIIFSLISINALKAQEKIRDTLYFRLDNYLYQSKFDSKKYFIKGNGDTSEGAIYFTEIKIINNAKPKKILCFKKFAKSSKLYMINNKKKLNDVKVMNLGDKHIVILINKNNEYIQVGAEFAIQ
jgi:predicted phosphodiesterase